MEVSGTAAAAASDVAGTAKEQVGAVAGEAASQVRGLLDQTRSQVAEQANGAHQKIGQTLNEFVSDLRDMARGSGSGSGPAAEIVQQVADRGQALADQVESMSPGEILQELRAFASRRPGAFLLGALAAGAVTGRLVRGASAASSSSSGSGRPVAALESSAPKPYPATGTDYSATSTGYTSSATYGTPATTTAYDDAALDEVTPLPGTTPGPGLR